MEPEKLLKDLRIQNWIILLILGLFSSLLMSPGFTLGIILGGLIIIANFSVLQHTISKGFSYNGVFKKKKGLIVFKYYLRLAVIGALIYFLITRQWVHPVGLTVGLSTVVFSIIGLGIYMSLKRPSGEAR